MAHKAEIVIVAAMSRNSHAIGCNNGLLWHISDDLKRFKEKTGSYPIIMGRKTFESILNILGKPLPGRQNIVVTRDPDYAHPGVVIASSFDRALETARELDTDEIHIGGGGEIYALALPLVDKLYLTFVDDEPAADIFFPDFESDFEIIQTHEKREHNGLTYQWIDYRRK